MIEIVSYPIGLNVISCVCDVWRSKWTSSIFQHGSWGSVHTWWSWSDYQSVGWCLIHHIWSRSSAIIWLSSGGKDVHTKRLMIDGHHIGWYFVNPTYIITSTTLNDGSQRSLCLNSSKIKVWCRGSQLGDPSSIQRLRVSLATIPFSTQVQDFVRSNIVRVAAEARVTVSDINTTLKFTEYSNELFQIMNSKESFTWTDD